MARALVITEGTSANHVRHILLKLGAPSWARVAALMAEDKIFRAERAEDES
ncbi:MAG TPA: hypothetical protein VHL09_10955 [Dehalococcoidia bacterium]|nr:hypothetical protein [Dehalococcoidia bacterium]